MFRSHLMLVVFTVAGVCIGLGTPGRNAWSVQPNSLIFTIEPTSGSVGQTLATITVSVEDKFGNVITTDNTSQVQLTLSINTLNGTTTQTVVNGVATYSDLSINTIGTGYTLTANSTNVGPPPLNTAIRTPFDIGPGAPAKLAFGQQPSDTLAGEYINPAVTVVVEDAGGNPVIGDSSTLVTVSMTLCAAPITLEAETDSAGVATFPNLRLNTVAAGDLLDASASGLTGTTSTAFAVLTNPDRVFFDGFDDPVCTP